MKLKRAVIDRKVSTMIHHRLARLARLALAAGATVAAIAAAAVPFAASATSAEAATSNLFASVSATGTLLHGGRVTGVTRFGPGRYEVTFAANVRRCAYVATTINASSQALQAFTAGGHLSADGVYVETKNQGGGLTDGQFNLIVDCGAPGTSYAVVGYHANLVRASRGTGLTNLGTGRYDLTFRANVRKCAYLATVGDPRHALVFNPNGVYTGSGPNAHTVYIETKNIGGGLSPGIPFHLAVICPSAARTEIAVVGASGIISRGSALTSSFSSATGQYMLVTNRALSACATVATRGSVNTAVPFSPATVEITPGPAGNTIGIQVRQLLFFGGALASQSFHSAMVC